MNKVYYYRYLPKTIAKSNKSQVNQGFKQLLTKFTIFQSFVQNYKSAFPMHKMLIWKPFLYFANAKKQRALFGTKPFIFIINLLLRIFIDRKINSVRGVTKRPLKYNNEDDRGKVITQCKIFINWSYKGIKHEIYDGYSRPDNCGF